MRKIGSAVLVGILCLTLGGALFSGDQANALSARALPPETLRTMVGGLAPPWACFGMGLIFGFAVGTGNGVLLLTSGIYIGTNCI